MFEKTGFIYFWFIDRTYTLHNTQLCIPDIGEMEATTKALNHESSNKILKEQCADNNEDGKKESNVGTPGGNRLIATSRNADACL